MYYFINLPNDRKSIFWRDGDTIISFPSDEGNKEYQDYIKWLKEGNTPKEWSGE